MSQHAETKRHFRLAMVQGTPPVAPSAAHARRWTQDFLEVLPIKYPAQPRLVNSFKVGADPEFVFADLERGIRVDAESFGLKTGMAFGADMNGRLVELRPQASEFMLDVLASILEELRWLAAYKRKAIACEWRAGAFLYKDGIGGHVHLGRKHGLKQVREWATYFNARHGHRGEPHANLDQPPQPEQLRRMDLIFYALTELGVYNKAQCVARQQGDQHGQQYGLPSDVRMQAHGYEYRAYPSWLDQPLSAYLALVLTKLAAYDPEVLPNPTKPPKNTETCLKLVKNFLAYYKGRDDDAAIAYAALARHGIPVYIGDDFKSRWGVGYTEMAIPPYIPDVIPGAEETKAELFDYLMENAPLMPRRPLTTWNSLIPSGFSCCLHQIENTRGMRGLGELAVDLFCADRQPVRLACSNEHDEFVVGRMLPIRAEGRRLLHKYEGYVRGGAGNSVVQVPNRWREPASLARTKEVLQALVPVWSAHTLQTTKVEATPQRKERWIGKVLS